VVVVCCHIDGPLRILTILGSISHQSLGIESVNNFRRFTITLRGWVLKMELYNFWNETHPRVP